MGKRATVLRRAALVCVIAGLALGAVGPAERAFALDQPVTSRDGVTALAVATSTNAQAAQAGQAPAPRTKQPWTAIVAVAVAGAAAIALLAMLFSRNLARLARSTLRAGSAKPEEFFTPPPRRAEAPAALEPAPAGPREQPEQPAQPEAPAVTAGPAPATAVAALAGPRREAAANGRARRGDHNGGTQPRKAQPGAAHNGGAQPRKARAAAARNGGAQPRKARPAAARKAPVCQVHWIERGARFCAMTIDADGVEHRLASSPRIESPRGSPPEQTPEAQRALRQLAKELRERGWKPLRAKGKDFDEPQWYARRFKQPPPEAPAEAAEGSLASIPVPPR